MATELGATAPASPDLRARARTVFVLSLLAAAVSVAVCPLVGGSGLDYGRVWAGQAPDWPILINLRLPRALLALLAGAALSGSGAMFQALLRDALATPSSLGVTAASALGAVVAIAFFPSETSWFPVVWISALAGAGAVIALVAALSRSHKRFSAFTLLLTGIAVNGICSALILLLHSLAGITKAFQITHWLMGGIAAVEYPVLALLALVIVPVNIWVLRLARVLNVISYGEAWAAGRGVDCRSVTLRGFIAGTVLVGTTTAVTGPIAFVGLIVPHLLRRIVGPDYRLLLPASIFGGGAFLVVCDTISRSVLAPVEIPVGVATALLGGPFFVWILWSR
ncbi:MAG: iron ABC transporter permease [Acidobacteria bacterium]|nr:iron ABC transporter permease [Acidobacteriota bacterium]